MGVYTTEELETMARSAGSRTYTSAASALALIAACVVLADMSAAAPAHAQSARSRVDAATAVRRAAAFVEQWQQDRNRTHLDEALDLLERARNTRYGKADVLAWIGYVHLERGEPALAIAPLREAIQTSPKAPAPYIDLAYALDRQGDYAQAADYLKTAATLVPPDRRRNDSVDGAHDILLRHIYLDLGGEELRAGRDAEAIDALRHARDLNARIASTRTAEARVRMNHRLRDYLDEDEPRIEDALASALRHRGDYEGAIDAERRATTLRPANPSYWRDLAQADQSAAVHAKAGAAETVQLWRKAANDYAQAVALDPDNAALRDQYGVALSEAGRNEDAAAQFARADALRPAGERPTDVALFHRGLAEWQLGHTEQATELFRRAGAGYPEHAQTLAWQGLAALRNRDPRSAIAPLERAAQLDPTSVATHLDLAAAYVQTGQPAKALPEYQRVVELAPNSLAGYYGLGRTLMDLMRYAEATSALRRADAIAARRGPETQVALYGSQDGRLTRGDVLHALGLSLELGGDLAGAADVYESALAAGGSEADMVQLAAEERYLLATREPSDANWERAEKALDRAARLAPSRHTLESYGDALRARKKFAEAAPQYARAIDLGLAEPHGANTDAEATVYTLREKYADTLRRIGRDADAIKQLETAVQQDPANYNVLVVLGALYQQQARAASGASETTTRDSWNAKAAAVYRRALDAQIPPAAPNSPVTPPKIEIRRAMAPLYYRLGRFDDAAATAAEVLKEDPADVNTAVIQYMVLAEQKHDIPAGRAVLESALSHASASPAGDRSARLNAERTVAYQYLRQRPLSAAELHQAGLHYARALEIDPKDAESLNGRGYIAMQRKDYPEAVELFKQAVAANPHDAVAYNNLGEAYEHLKGDYFADVLASYRSAYRENPNMVEARRNAERYAKYAKFGWEPKDQLPANKSIPVYRRGAATAPRSHSTRHRTRSRRSRRGLISSPARRHIR
jgi:tetratricopeptide (TPR) repeat protein